MHYFLLIKEKNKQTRLQVLSKSSYLLKVVLYALFLLAHLTITNTLYETDNIIPFIEY